MRFCGGGLNGSPGVRDDRGLSRYFSGGVVSFGRYFGGVVGKAWRGYVRWHSDRQVERDQVRRLSSIPIAITQHKRDVYPRDVQLVEKARFLIKIRTNLRFDRYLYLMRSDNVIRVQVPFLIKTQYKVRRPLCRTESNLAEIRLKKESPTRYQASGSSAPSVHQSGCFSSSSLSHDWLQ